MPNYGVEFTLRAAAHLDAESVEKLRELLAERLDCITANLGLWPENVTEVHDAFLAEVSFDIDSKPEIFEIDGEEVTTCPDCGAVEGTPEWGTVGDGFDGYCPSCADKRDAEPGCIHKSCDHCELDIEGMAPYPDGEWRDRGNNTHCPDGRWHTPQKEV